MKKMILAALLLISVPAFGEQKDGFWGRLQTKLEKVTPAKKVSAATAVGGVRGAKNDDASDIYWKGRDKASDMNEEEFDRFNRALESGRKGESELALRQFEEFLEMYPQSQFRVEGLQAAEKLRADIGAQKTAVKTEPAPKPAEPGAAPPAALTPGPAPEAGKPVSEPQAVK